MTAVMDRTSVVLPVPGPPVITETLWGQHLRQDHFLLLGEGDGELFQHRIGDRPAIRRGVTDRNALHGDNAPGDGGFGLVKRAGKDQGRLVDCHEVSGLHQIVQGGGTHGRRQVKGLLTPLEKRRLSDIGVPLIDSLFDQVQKAGLGPVHFIHGRVRVAHDGIGNQKSHAGDILGRPIRIVAQDLHRVVSVLT